MTEWRLIETAPDDGRQILVGFAGQFEWFSYVAPAHGKDTGPFALPTHWAPITPPNIGQQPDKHEEEEKRGKEMPLTQDRMIEVLEEAQEARDYALSLQDNIGRILEIENSFMALAALRELYDHLALPSMTRCAIEREHFAKRARANEANARRTARARAKRRVALHGDDHDNVNDATARKDGK